jgi:hypothetical protein
MVRDRILPLAAGLALGFLAQAPAARAAVTVTASVGGSPAAHASRADLDDLPLGTGGGSTGGLSIGLAGGAEAVTGSGFGYTAPTLASGPDSTPFLSTVLGTITVTLPQSTTYFGLLWGSIDTFNILSFYDHGTLVGRLTGADLPTDDFGDIGLNGTMYVNLLSSMPFDSVIMASNGYSFEIDDLAYGSSGGGDPDPVPEPWSLALLGLGILGAGVLRSRRMKTAA